MELNLQKQPITINEVVYDSEVEQPIECDVLLPDYCPDIIKILKCAVNGSVSSANMNGDRLTIDGIASVRVFYSAENNSIRSTEYKIPFSKIIDLKNAPEMPIIVVNPTVGYINCRAVNQRRIDVRGAINLSVKIYANREDSILSDAQGAGVQLRRKMINCTKITNHMRTFFPLEEELEIGYGKPPIGSIIRSDGKISVIDHKIVSGKVILKGDFNLLLTYIALDDGEIQTMQYSLPVSQIIDCTGVDENSICDILITTQGCDITPKMGEENEYTKIELSAKIDVCITVHENKELSVNIDSYSTQYESKCSKKEMAFVSLEQMIDETATLKNTLDLPENVDSIIDLWFNIDSCKWSYNSGVIKIEAKILVCMFARVVDAGPSYFEQTLELVHEIKIKDAKNIRFNPNISIISSDYSLNGSDKLDVRCDVRIKGCLYATVSYECISDIQIDENAQKQRGKEKLYLYYADEGESIWDIAKKYNTSANDIWEENTIESDILPAKNMLIIPMT